MPYQSRHQAEAAMAARAEITQAPALTLVYDPAENTYHVVEADEEGVVVIRTRHIVLDTTWTARSAGVTELLFKNAYTVSCCYAGYYSRDEIVFTEHGEADLSEALNAALEAANSNDCWRSCDDVGDSFIESIAESSDIDRSCSKVAVPEDYAEGGPRPIVLIHMAGGRIDDVKVMRGEARVIAVSRDGEALDRGPYITVHDQLGEALLTHWSGPDDPASLPDGLLGELGMVPHRTSSSD